VDLVCSYAILLRCFVQVERDHLAAKARLESEFSEKLECLRERLEAGVQDKRKELEAKNAADLQQLRSELDIKYREVRFQCFLYLHFLSY